MQGLQETNQADIGFILDEEALEQDEFGDPSLPDILSRDSQPTLKRDKS